MDTINYKYLGSLSDLAYKVVGTVFICSECQVGKDVVLSRDEITSMSLVYTQEENPYILARIRCRYCNDTTTIAVDLPVDKKLDQAVDPY